MAIRSELKVTENCFITMRFRSVTFPPSFLSESILLLLGFLGLFLTILCLTETTANFRSVSLVTNVAKIFQLPPEVMVRGHRDESIPELDK